jgi:hypothetical protein
MPIIEILWGLFLYVAYSLTGNCPMTVFVNYLHSLLRQDLSNNEQTIDVVTKLKLQSTKDVGYQK